MCASAVEQEAAGLDTCRVQLSRGWSALRAHTWDALVALTANLGKDRVSGGGGWGVSWEQEEPMSKSLGFEERDWA